MSPKAYLSRSKTGTSVEEVLELIPTQTEVSALKAVVASLKVLTCDGIPMELRNEVIVTCIEVLGSLESCPYNAAVLHLEKMIK